MGTWEFHFKQKCRFVVLEMIGPHFEKCFLLTPLLCKVPAVGVLESHAKGLRAACPMERPAMTGVALWNLLMGETLATWYSIPSRTEELNF